MNWPDRIFKRLFGNQLVIKAETIRNDVCIHLPRIGNGFVWTDVDDGNILFDAVGDIALEIDDF